MYVLCLFQVIASVHLWRVPSWNIFSSKVKLASKEISYHEKQFFYSNIFMHYSLFYIIPALLSFCHAAMPVKLPDVACKFWNISSDSEHLSLPGIFDEMLFQIYSFLDVSECSWIPTGVRIVTADWIGNVRHRVLMQCELTRYNFLAYYLCNACEISSMKYITTTKRIYLRHKSRSRWTFWMVLHISKCAKKVLIPK